MLRDGSGVFHDLAGVGKWPLGRIADSVDLRRVRRPVVSAAFFQFPFNGRVTQYANPEWPSGLLASMDGVAIDSVGVDILNSQIKNNEDEHHHSRILLRENSDDHLQEEALAFHPHSGTTYRQNRKLIASLGVFEHWDSDATRQHTRNQDPKPGKGIEPIYLPLK